MTFFDIVSGAAEGGDVDALRSMLAPAISQGLSEGLSGASMLRTFREAGGAIRTYDFQRLVGEVRSSQAMAEAWTGQDLSTVPGADVFVQHTGSAYRGLEYRVPIFFREQAEGGAVPGHTVFSIRTPVPMTPQEAIDQATALFQQGTGGETPYPQEFLGVGTVGFHSFGP